MTRSFRAAVASVGLGLLVLVLTMPGAVAQESVVPAIVAIRPVGPDGLEGFAILTPSDGATTVQVKVKDAPEGTSAAIHPGTCDALDPLPVGLLRGIEGRDLVSATVPLPFATLADGAHSVALHPGLDLATVLGCGVIPVAAGATPVPTVAPGSPAATERFDGTRYPFALAWSAPWTRYEYQGPETSEGVTLANGTSTAILEAFDQALGDAAACRDAWEDGLVRALREGSIQALAPATDAAGVIIWGGDAERAQGGYTWVRTSEPDATWAEVIDCRRLTDGAVLRITHLASSASFLAEVPTVEALLTGLELGGSVPLPTAAPPTPVAPTPVPVTPAPVVTPEPVVTPTPGPDCTGMQPWVDAAVGRVERMRELAQRVERSKGVREVYIGALREASSELGFIRSEQAADPPPPSLAKIQVALDELYAAYIDAYLLLADAFQYEDQTLLGQAAAKGQEAEAIARQIQTDAREILTPCGIRLPT